MEAFGIKITVEELKVIKEIVPYVGVNIIILVLILVLVLFVLWSYRENILRIIQYFLREKPPYKKIKCTSCRKKMFSFTHKNIHPTSPSYFIEHDTYHHDCGVAGDFLICSNCREVVGIWRTDNTLDQYKIVERDSWNNLLKRHGVCFLSYDIHIEWIKELHNNLTLCFVRQLPTYGMEVRIINCNTLKHRIASIIPCQFKN